MLGVIESACAAAVRQRQQESVFDLWHAVYREQVVRNDAGIAPLLTGFGVSLVERAAIDAFCRAGTMPFAEAVRSNALGLPPRSAAPGVGGVLRPGAPARTTADEPSHPAHRGPERCAVRRRPSAGPADGLPASLEACIRRYGLRRFKVKICGDRRHRPGSPGQVRDVLERETGGDYRLTLDGNEQYAEHLRPARLLGRAGGDRSGRPSWRSGSTTSSSRSRERCPSARKPRPRSSPPGRSVHGSSSTRPTTPWTPSHGRSRPATTVDPSRARKGVFKGVGNACRIELLRRRHPEHVRSSTAPRISPRSARSPCSPTWP